MRAVIVIEGKPGGKVDIAFAADRDWREDRSQAMPFQRVTEALIEKAEQETQAEDA